jgi:hypothetical protein
MPNVREQMFWAQPVILPCLAFVSKVRVIDQRVHVDCYDGETGQTWYRLPILVFGGGQGSSLVVPPVPYPRETVQQPEEEEGSQVLVVPRHKQGPVALMVTQHPLAGFQDVAELDEAERTAQDDQDHPLPRTPEEHVWEHRGVRVQLTSDGSVVIDATASQKPVRIQLAKDAGLLRVSRDGQAGERLVLAGPLGDYHQSEASYRDGVQDRLAALESMVSTLAGIETLTFTPGQGSDPPETPSVACATIHVSEDVEG